MFSGPTIQNAGDLGALRDESFRGVIADGTLSSGQRYEIRISDKSALTDGVHLVITYPDAKSLSPEEAADGFQALNHFASQQPLARQFGYTFSQNFGAMLNRPQPHAHAMLPGSAAEADRAPALQDPAPETILDRGQLQSGREFELSIVRSDAIQKGLHFVMLLEGNGSLRSQEAREVFELINAHARVERMAAEFGYRFTEIFRADGSIEIVATVPGSSAEKTSLPRIIDPWQGFSES